MKLRNLVIQSQLIPPRTRRGILRRPRIQARIADVMDFPLMLVLAGTGYGKSTALTELTVMVENLFWYSITESDRDPLLFLVHLLSAFNARGQHFGDEALQFLEENNQPKPVVLTPLINSLTQNLKEEAVLVLDDFHLVQDVPEIGALVNRLITLLPPHLHMVISSRHTPELLDLHRWSVKGRMVTLTHTDLALTTGEIESLFGEVYNYPITPAQAARLQDETEGWALALQMIWQSLQREPTPRLEEVLDRFPDNLSGLFDYLAPEVLARQPQDVQDFMITTSVLRQLDAAACDALMEEGGSRKMLRRLHESGLFLELLGEDSYRCQRLFHDFLRDQLRDQPERKKDLHRKAAGFFESQSNLGEAIYHLLEAGDLLHAAELIEQIGPELVRSGRLEGLMGWIQSLPLEMLTNRPELELLRGDVMRLRADFDAALDHYMLAEHLYRQTDNRRGCSRALRAQAKIYLDTVRPIKADTLIDEALHLLDPVEYNDEVAELLDQHAENKLNLGYPNEALALHQEARALRKETNLNDVYLEGRVLLRTGRLIEGRRLLEQQATSERLKASQRPQRFHRETLLLLSLICSIMGDGEYSERYSTEGIEIGRQLQSDFVEAVGYMRLGHALQLNLGRPWFSQPVREALLNYQRSIDQVHPFKVARVGVEPLWGVCRAYGYAGDILTAESKAQSALEISEMAGDEWIGNLVRTGMGASLALNGQYDEAKTWLNRAKEGFRRVDDWCGWSAAMMWLALTAWWKGEEDTALDLFSWLAPVARANEFDFLLTRSSLLGLKDEQAIVPLLLEARRRGIEAEYCKRLLVELTGTDDLEYHPGYTLWVRTLGAFNVWRGDTPVSAHDWQREKARQLFQLLVAQRGQRMQREQIVDLLWPDLPPDLAVRDFKVALNALNHALEPARPRNAQPFFVIREDNSYRFNPAARIRIDLDEFEHLSAQGEDCSDAERTFRRALRLYEEDFLPDARYEDWATAERDRLRHAFLSTTGRLAACLVERRAWDEVIALSNQTLVRDNCWEPGYRYLMQAYAGKGNLPQVQVAYNRCVAALRDELAVDPSSETRGMLKRMMQG